MLQTHDQFEELCALAAVGQVSADELSQLTAHAKTCAECRSLLKDFGQVIAQGLPAIDLDHMPAKVPSGMTERFVARAHSQGILLSPAKSPDEIVLKRKLSTVGIRDLVARGIRKYSVFAAIPALAVLLLLVLQRAFDKGSETPSSHAAEQAVVPSAGRIESNDVARQIAELKQQLRELEEGRRLLISRNSADQKALQAGDRERSQIGARLSALETTNLELAEELRDRESRLGEFKEQVGKLQSENEAGRIAGVVEEAELANLRQEVTRQRDQLEERRQLDEASTRARDLIVARNLHIVDVHDTNEHGEGQRAFGRIFLTEGKSLVFYAYDLAGPRERNTKTAFYVWGERLGTEQAAKNLGVFRRDRGTDERWVLTFTNPRVLSELDSGFVTVESDKSSPIQPGGKRVLYAYLGNKPNHP